MECERAHGLALGTLGRVATYRAVDSLRQLPNRRMEPRPTPKRRAAR
jgi:hypothetical protein